MGTDHFDVLILGAGLSGIDMACRLAIACPEKQVAVVEARHAIGGTWDLFRYPGVRSDSDMCTFGYPFRPWGTVQVMSVPSRDVISAALLRVFPARWVHAMTRRRNIALQRLLYRAAQRWPSRIRAILLAVTRRQLRDGASIDDFSPTYEPWAQRLCVLPDANLFVALREGRARVVTDTVLGFTRDGVSLASGRTVPADIVVTATGFHLQALGGMALEVDGVLREPGHHATYKGVLIDGIPNLAVLFGYINASWTLKIDLAAQYVCRLLQHMDGRGAAVATPHAPPDTVQEGSILDALKAGYVRRGAHTMPRQGRSGPWRVTHRYEVDRRVLLDDAVDDPFLRLS